MVAGNDGGASVGLTTEVVFLLGEREVDRNGRRSRCRKLVLDDLSVAIMTSTSCFSIHTSINEAVLSDVLLEEMRKLS